MLSADRSLEIGSRVITNAQWASTYFAYFDASNHFLRARAKSLNSDALDFLNVIDRGFPRLAAICLCRLWDAPGRDRHSLPALLRLKHFQSLVSNKDPQFGRDCKRFELGLEITKLKKFRNVDLAHNLPLISKGDGFTIDELRLVLQRTQLIIDRLVRILEVNQVQQSAIFDRKRLNCQTFWQAFEQQVLLSK